MDALTRLGARAIGATAGGAAVRPVIAPLFVAPPDATPPPETIGADADPVAPGPALRHPVRSAPGPPAAPTAAARAADTRMPASTEDQRIRDVPGASGTPETVELPRPIDDSADSGPRAGEMSGLMPQEAHASEGWMARREAAGSRESVIAPRRVPDARGASRVPAPRQDVRDTVSAGATSDATPASMTGRTVAGRETDGGPSSRFFTRLRAIRESVAAPEVHHEERPPAVRVTIGRIDVRSTPAVEPAPRREPARAPDSRMTLAEYLTRKRPGGL